MDSTPTSKAARLANYVVTLRKEMLGVTRACGLDHPAQMTGEHFEIIHREGSSTIYDAYHYQHAWGKPREESAAELVSLMHDGSKVG